MNGKTKKWRVSRRMAIRWQKLTEHLRGVHIKLVGDNARHGSDEKKKNAAVTVEKGVGSNEKDSYRP